MKKLKINLSPNKPTNLDENFSKILNYLPLLILGVVFFAFILGVFEIATFVKARQLNSLEKVWQDWEPKHNEMSGIKQRRLALRREKQDLKEITSPQDKSFLLEAIFTVIPKNIWLQRVDYLQDSVKISGYILRWEEDTIASLESFIGGLQEFKSLFEQFNTISIKDAKTIDFRGREVTQFFLECKK